MAEQTISTRIKQKIDTTANWTTRNPILLNGEIGLERTTSGDIKIKIGDGTTAWNSLDYLVTESQEGESVSYVAGPGIKINGNTISSSYGEQKTAYVSVVDSELDISDPVVEFQDIDGTLPDTIALGIPGELDLELGDIINIELNGNAWMSGELNEDTMSFFGSMDPPRPIYYLGDSYLVSAVNGNEDDIAQWKNNPNATLFFYQYEDEMSIISFPRTVAQELIDENNEISISITKQSQVIDKIPVDAIPDQLPTSAIPTEGIMDDIIDNIADDTLAVYEENNEKKLGLARRIGHTKTDKISIVEKPIWATESSNNIYTHTIPLEAVVQDDASISIENELFSINNISFETASYSSSGIRDIEFESERLGGLFAQNPFVYNGIYGYGLVFTNTDNIRSLKNAGTLNLFANGSLAESFTLTRHIGTFEYTNDLPEGANEEIIPMFNMMESNGQLKVYMSNVDNPNEIRRGLLLQALANLVFEEEPLIADITQYSIPTIQRTDPLKPACAIAAVMMEQDRPTIFTAATYFQENITTYDEINLNIFGVEAKGFTYNTNTSLANILFANASISKSDDSKKPSFAAQLIDNNMLQIISDTDLTNTTLKIEAEAAIEQKWKGEEIEVGSGLEVRNHKIDFPYGHEYMAKQVYVTISINYGENDKSSAGTYYTSNSTSFLKNSFPYQFQPNKFINVSYQAKNRRKHTKTVQIKEAVYNEDENVFAAYYNINFENGDSADEMSLINKLEPGFFIYVNQNAFDPESQNTLDLIIAYFISPTPFSGFKIELFDWEDGLNKIPAEMLEGTDIETTNEIQQGSTMIPTAGAVYSALQSVSPQGVDLITQGSHSIPTADAVYNFVENQKISAIKNTADIPTASAVYSALSNYVLASNLTSTLSSYPTLSSLNNTLTNYVLTSNLTSTLSNYVLTSNLNSTLTNYVQTVNGVAPINGAVSVPTVSSITSGSVSIPTAAAVYDLFQAFIDEVIEEEY